MLVGSRSRVVQLSLIISFLSSVFFFGSNIPACADEGTSTARTVSSPEAGRQRYTRDTGGKTVRHARRTAVAGRLIVGFRARSASPASRVAVHAAAGARIRDSFTIINADLVELPREMTLHEGIAWYIKQPDVAYVQPDYYLYPMPVEKGPVLDDIPAMASEESPDLPNDPLFRKQWAVYEDPDADPEVDIDAVAAWDITRGSRDVVVAVIDTGVDYEHKDLRNQMWTNEAEKNGRKGVDDDGNGYVDDIYGYNFSENTGNPMDRDGHGTHCAGIIAAEQNNGKGITGIAPGVRIMAIKFIGSKGGATSHAIKGFQYARKMGATLSSNSYGGYYYDPAFMDAIASFGRLAVFAAGNESYNNDNHPAYPASFPLDNIVSVMATNQSGYRAPFSNFGLNTVHIGAPGDQILSCYKGNKYMRMSGTSMAAPHVAAVAALIYSHYPQLSFHEVKQRLLAHGKPFKTMRRLTASGRFLNARRSLGNANLPPVALGLGLSGKAEVGETIRATYTYLDNDGDKMKSARVDWYVTDRVTGEETLVRSNSESFTPGPEHGDNLIKYTISVNAKTGNKKGFRQTYHHAEPIYSKWPISRVYGYHAKGSHYVTIAADAYTVSDSRISEYGVEWYPLDRPAEKRTKVLGHRKAEWSNSVSGLKPDTTYVFQAYAVNGNGRTESPEWKIRTLTTHKAAHKLLPLLPATEILAGEEVHISGNVAVLDQLDTAEFKIYRYNAGADIWQYEDTVVHPTGNDFVYHTGMNSEYLFLPVSNERVIYIYGHRNGSWKQVQKIKVDTWGSYRVVATDDLMFVSNYIGKEPDTHYETELLIYRLNRQTGKWIRKQTITVPTGAPSAYFGTGVAVSGDRMIVRESFNNWREEAPRIYFFERNSLTDRWEEKGRFKMNDNKRIGLNYSIAIEGDFAAVAMQIPHLNHSQGRVVVFRRDTQTGTWKQWQTIPSPPDPRRQFYSFAVNLAMFNGNIYVTREGVRRWQVDLFRKDSNGLFQLDDSATYYGTPNARSIGITLDYSDQWVILGDLNDHEIAPASGAATIIPLSAWK